MAVLLLLTGPLAGSRHEVSGEVILGRSPSCTIALDDAKVSRRHVRILIEGGQAHVSDLGSRNGTVVNGDKLEGEVTLLPGDRLQVGDSTILYEPPARAALSERDDAASAVSAPVEELLPVVGAVSGLYNAGVALISSTSEAMVLRRAAEELARGVNADKAAALLGGTEGLLTAAVVGAANVEVPRAMVRGALDRTEASRLGGSLCAPLLASGGSPFGILYAERVEPFTDDDQKMIAALGRLAGEAVTALRSRQDEGAAGVTLVGASRPFRKTVEQARRAASNAEPVVIYGEDGTGRSLLATYIHTRSARALGPMVVVDCRRAVSHIDEVLFGRGSAPGLPPASSALLKADGGSLVLLDVDHLPRSAAERLGRLLIKKAAPARRGGEEPVDVRVIATSVHSVSVMTQRSEIDGELAKALTGSEIDQLPLRERKQDVLQLFEHFATAASKASRREVPALSPDARRLLSEYHWPGNVEELRGVSERLALLYSGKEVPALRLPPEIQEGPGATGAPRTLADMIARLERDAIAEALRETRGKKIKAAALLGISRPTLDKKIEDYHLVVEKRRG